MRENPTTLRNQEDIIGKIANGEFKKEVMDRVLDKEAKKAARDKKYGLASKSGRGGVALSDEQTSGDGGISPGAGGRAKGFDKQSLKNMGKKSPTASGKFRKAGSSYFRKKLKAQMTSEFSDGRN